MGMVVNEELFRPGYPVIPSFSRDEYPWLRQFFAQTSCLSQLLEPGLALALALPCSS